MSEPAVPTGRGRWLSLTGATAAQIGIAYLEQGVTALVPYIKADYGFPAWIAGIFGVAVNGGRSLSGVLAARPVDRFGERRMILAGGAVSGTLAIAAALAPTAPATLVLIMLAGVAQTVSILAGITAVATWFHSGNRAIAMGIRQAAVPAGGIVSAATLPLIALAADWRDALLVAGGVAIVLSAAGALILGESRTHRPATGRPSLRAAVREIVRDGQVVRAVLAASILGASQFATLTYIQLFLVEDLHAGLRLAALVLAATSAAGFAGRIIWGLASDLLFGGNRRGILLAILGLATAGALGMALSDTRGGLSLAIPMALLLGFTTVGSPGIYLALITEIGAPRHGSVTTGVGISVIQGSSLVVPPVFGALADATSSYRAGWLLLAGLLVLAVPLVATLRTARHA